MKKEIVIVENNWSGGVGDGVNISLNVTVGSSIDKFRELMLSEGDFLPKTCPDWEEPNASWIEENIDKEYLKGGMMAHVSIWNTKTEGVQFVYTYNDYKDTMFVGIFKDGKFVFELKGNENIKKDIKKLNRAIKKYI